MKQKGFTLIELLVVIAIIALLLGIILPSLSKARDFAQEVLCKTNIHQYQIATELYCNENDERMPNPWESLYSKVQFAGEAQRYCRWHNPEFNLDANAYEKDAAGNLYAGPYWPYLAETKANVCPLFAKIAATYAENHMEGNGSYTASDCIGGPFVANFSYSMNSIFLMRDQDGQSIPVGQKGFKTHRKFSVKSPSDTFLWAEENMWTLKSIKTGRRLSYYVLNDNALATQDENTVIDCFASYHKISTAKLGVQRRLDLAGTGSYDGTGVANVVLVDGSVAWLKPDDTTAYRGKVPVGR